ncbi:hypothetical protein HD_0597 [[Haemophilus] ducreyi 35000HP]|uniref:Uncharacterized protein n=1 Tax=Haemophilus ducreyi (strain 35000HP / ATCC 700724) TaxID=233412 RepID=Q7VNF1_HAEDU|nr:hypothetical protein HD_0597 [[Haemophilus] ducreyi 35000HP]
MYGVVSIFSKNSLIIVAIILIKKTGFLNITKCPNSVGQF